jgi:hypothetical protein
MKVEYKSELNKWIEIPCLPNTKSTVLTSIAFEYSKKYGVTTRVVEYNTDNSIKVINEFKRSK